MAEIGSAFLSIMPSARDFGRRTEGQIGPQMTGVAKRTGSRFGKVFAYSSMSPLKAIGAAAVGLFAVQKVKDFFGSAIDEARESQKVSALTAQVIKSTGGAAGISAKQIGEMAGRLSQLTGIDDEAIQGGENLLLTFKNIKDFVGGQFTGTFTDATGVMTDMSVALGQDMKSSALQIGKALNDPIKGITALSRVGVSFTDQQKEQIKTLVDSGKVTEAQRIILAELKSEFGGAAAAAATAGDKFKTTFANFQESVGTALLPYLDRALVKGTEFITFLMDRVPPAFAAFKAAIAPVTAALSDLIANNLEPFKTALAALGGAGVASLIALIGGGLVAALGALLSALASPVVVIGALVGAAIYAYTRFEKFREVVGQVVAWLRSDFIPGFLAVVEGVRAFVASVWPIITEFVTGLIARIQPLLPRIASVFQQIWSTIKDAVTLIAAVVKGAVAIISFEWEHFGTFILDFLGRTFGNIVTVVSGVLNVLQGVIRLVLSLIKGDWSGAWDALKQIVRGAWQVISGIVKQAIAQVQLVLNVAWTVIKAGASKAWDGIKAATSAAWNAIKGYVSDRVAAMKSAVASLADLVGKVRGWFGDILAAIKDKLGDAVAFVKTVPGKMLAAFAGMQQRFYDAGAKLVSMLGQGIRDKASDAINAVKDLAGKLAGFVPGSPVKEGPLKSFNGGHAGRLLMEMLADGIAGAGPKVLKSMKDALDKTLSKVTEFRDNLKSRLDSVKSLFDSVASSVSSAFSADLFQAANVNEFFSGLANQNNTLRAMLKAFKTLKGWGIPGAFLSQLFASGNSALILELASDRGNAEIASGAFSFGQSLSQQLGQQVAQNQYGAQISGLDAKLARIENHTRRLEHLAKDIGRELNAAVSHGQKKAS